MKDFQFFIDKGDVRKQTKDTALAKSIIKDSFQRLNFVKSHSINKDNSKYILENIYESLRELADAKLLIDGFKSYSHEATISYLKKFKEFREEEIVYFDELRRKRNGIKYYGEDVDITDVKSSLDFAEKIIPKLKKLTEKQ